MKNLDNTAIACSLTRSEFHDREARLLAQFRSAIVEAKELQEGYTFRLPNDDNWIMLVAELIVAERECCPFLTFELTALPNRGPLIVRVIGPPGDKEFVKTVLWKPTHVRSSQHRGHAAGDPRRPESTSRCVRADQYS